MQILFQRVIRFELMFNSDAAKGIRLMDLEVLISVFEIRFSCCLLFFFYKVLALTIRFQTVA